MSDINFTVDQASAPDVATKNFLVYAQRISTGGDVVLGQGKLYYDSGKIISQTGKIRMPQAIISRLYTGKQSVNAYTSPTTIDLSLGATITLYQTSSTVIKWANLPTEGIRFFKIFRQHDNTTNTYNVTFDTSAGSYTWYKEGRQLLTLTQAAYATDDIYGWVDSAGNTVTFMPTMNYGTVSAGAQSTQLQLRGPADTRAIVPKGNTIANGAVCTTMSDLTMNATDITYDGNETFDSLVALDGITAHKTNIRHSFATSSSTFTVDLSKDDFISLTHNSDIETFDVIQSDPDVSTPCVIWRMKDDSSTPRLINFGADVFYWGIDPQLTQFNVGLDVIVITSSRGENKLAVFNDFNDLG